MNGIKLIGLATILAGGMGLASCSHPMADKKMTLEQEYINTGVSADKFIKMKAKIDELGSKPVFCNSEVRDAKRAFGWTEELNNIKMQKSIDSTRMAVIDSFERAAKVVGKIK